MNNPQPEATRVEEETERSRAALFSRSSVSLSVHLLTGQQLHRSSALLRSLLPCLLSPSSRTQGTRCCAWVQMGRAVGPFPLVDASPGRHSPACLSSSVVIVCLAFCSARSLPRSSVLSVFILFVSPSISFSFSPPTAPLLTEEEGPSAPIHPCLSLSFKKKEKRVRLSTRALSPSTRCGSKSKGARTRVRWILCWPRLDADLWQGGRKSTFQYVHPMAWSGLSLSLFFFVCVRESRTSPRPLCCPFVLIAFLSLAMHPSATLDPCP